MYVYCIATHGHLLNKNLTSSTSGCCVCFYHIWHGWDGWCDVIDYTANILWMRACESIHGVYLFVCLSPSLIKTYGLVFLSSAQKMFQVFSFTKNPLARFTITNSVSAILLRNHWTFNLTIKFHCGFPLMIYLNCNQKLNGFWSGKYK